MVNRRKYTKMIHEGKYVAEVEVELINTKSDDWSPYISADDALKLDNVRELLSKNDVASAKKYAKVYILSEAA
ncbi:MAG: hypothetical protein OIF32_02820 [Campylobacterales bacterium]|nr:hypothetical protein [Campylobacterales bacterium]